MNVYRTTAVALSRRLPKHVTMLVALLVALLVAASPATASAPAPEKATAKFEVDFLTGMIDHHAMAIHMSEMCVDKAVHAELHAMCEDIIAAQSEEIETMQSWLQDWYGISHEPEMNRGHMRQMEVHASYTGARFEIHFMESMIRHHRTAIVEAELCLRRAGHEELRAMCQEIIEMQSAEIAQMQAWLCEWYGRCRGQSQSEHRYLG